MEKRIANLLLMNILLTLSTIGFIFVVFELTQFAFAFELLLLLAFICIFSFGMYNAYHGRKAGWILIASMLLAIIIDVIFISAISINLGLSHVFTLFFSIIALAVALISLRETHPEEEKIEDVGQYYSKSSKAEETKTENVKKNFEPGKYIASKKANKYHTAKCDWALRISKQNQIWFNTKEDAELKGFVRDKCVE